MLVVWISTVELGAASHAYLMKGDSVEIRLPESCSLDWTCNKEEPEIRSPGWQMGVTEHIPSSPGNSEIIIGAPSGLPSVDTGEADLRSDWNNK